MEEVVYQGKFIQVVKRKSWEFVERLNATGIVAIIPITNDNQIVLIKQFREPMQATVIEVPAGLVGDVDNTESLETAARRELLEETGYHAETLKTIGTFPISPGLSTEKLTYVLATDLEKRTEGGGDSSEQIEVYQLPINMAAAQLILLANTDQFMVDAKVFASLLFAYPVVAERVQSQIKS